jgi:hypothetical protein
MLTNIEKGMHKNTKIIINPKEVVILGLSNMSMLQRLIQKTNGKPIK